MSRRDSPAGCDGDCGDDGEIPVDEIITAVNRTLNGCGVLHAADRTAATP